MTIYGDGRKTPVTAFVLYLANGYGVQGDYVALLSMTMTIYSLSAVCIFCRLCSRIMVVCIAL